MANYDSNYAIAQEISARIGTSPIPFDSVYSIALEIYNELGGEPAQFDSVYSILLGILPLIEGGIASKVIDDNSIVLNKTWSSSKINEEIQAVGGTADSEFDGKTTEDFQFVTELPQEATEDEQVVIRDDNTDTLYKYVSGAWAEQTPDANILYFDTENEALYSYVSAEQQFATISSVSTIVVKNLNTSEALKAIKTPGTYSVLQRTSSTAKGEYTKKWTLTVEGIDYEEYELTDSVYQKLQSNYTIQKRTWSSTRATNDGWSSFSTYYAGEIKDSTTSKYYTWSSNKLTTELDAKQDTLTAGTNVDITDNTISAKGYTYDNNTHSFANEVALAVGNYSHNEGTAPKITPLTGITFSIPASGKVLTANGSLTPFTGGNNPTLRLGAVITTDVNNVTIYNRVESYDLNSNTITVAKAFSTAALSGVEMKIVKGIALGEYSHAEGHFTNADGNYSHAEGENTIARFACTHAEGVGSIAYGRVTHAEGSRTLALNQYEHAEGYQNVSHIESETYGDAGNTQHSIGINQKNAFEIMQNGDAYLYGVGGYVGTDTKVQDNTIKTLQEVIASLEARITTLENPNT